MLVFHLAISRHLNINRSIVNTSLCMTELILHLMAFKGLAQESKRVSLIKTSMKMLHNMCKLSLMLLGMKVFLQTHCTGNPRLSGYARLTRQSVKDG